MNNNARLNHLLCAAFGLEYSFMFLEVHLCFYGYENDGARFCCSFHFTVDEIPDRLCQHDVLRSPGENRAARGGIGNSGERSCYIFVSVFIGMFLTAYCFS